MSFQHGLTQYSPPNEYFTLVTGNPDADPEPPSLARTSVRAFAIAAPLNPDMSQLIVMGRNTEQPNHRESRKSELDSDQRKVVNSDANVNTRIHKISLAPAPEQVSRETVFEPLVRPRASEENSNKRARLVSNGGVEQIMAAASSKKGSHATEGEKLDQVAMHRAGRRRTIGDKFTVRIRARPLGNDDSSSLGGMERNAARRFLLRYNATWREVNEMLNQSATIFRMGHSWIAMYMDLDGDWVMLQDEFDLPCFLLEAQQTVTYAGNGRDQMPLMTIILEDQ